MLRICPRLSSVAAPLSQLSTTMNRPAKQNPVRARATTHAIGSTTIPAVRCRVEVESVIKIGGIETAAPGVHVNITRWLEASTDMRVAAHQANYKMIGNPVIKTYNKSACREIDALGILVGTKQYP